VTVRSRTRAGSPGDGRVRVRLFATARTAVGAAQLDWRVPPDGLPARELVEAVTARYPALRRIIATSRLFVDGAPVQRPDLRVRPGQELAVHPPYGGG
jgi:molybdopterin converting factor small subunit